MDEASDPVVQEKGEPVAVDMVAASEQVKEVSIERQFIHLSLAPTPNVLNLLTLTILFYCRWVENSSPTCLLMHVKRSSKIWWEAHLCIHHPSIHLFIFFSHFLSILIWSLDGKTASWNRRGKRNTRRTVPSQETNKRQETKSQSHVVYCKFII